MYGPSGKDMLGMAILLMFLGGLVFGGCQACGGYLGRHVSVEWTP